MIDVFEYHKEKLIQSGNSIQLEDELKEYLMMRDE